MNTALEALRRAPTDFAVTPDDIWDDRARPHVHGINEAALHAVRRKVDAAEHSPRSSVLGLPIVGPGGSGKSHLLGQARRLVQDRGGFFVRLDIVDVHDFWSSLASSFLYALDMPHRLGGSGLTVLLERLAEQADVHTDLRKRLLTSRLPDPEGTAQFFEAVRELDPSLSGTRDTLRSLLLLNAVEERRAAAGAAFLKGGDVDAEALPGFPRPAPQTHQTTVRDLSRLMAVCGATVIAVDQVDDIVRASRRSTAGEGASGAGELLDMLGIGLVDLRDYTRRSTVLLSCLDGTWEEFRRNTTDTVLQRFETHVRLDDTLPSAAVAADLLAAVLKPVYREAGYEPPYPSYPFPERALAQASVFGPRHLLRNAAEHVNRCVAAGRITEPERLEAPEPLARTLPPAPVATEDLDAVFEGHKAHTEIDTAIDPRTEDVRMPWLLSAALRAFMVETGRGPAEMQIELPVGERQPFHAALFDNGADPKRCWRFLAIANTHPRAVGHRVRGLYDRAGLGRDNPILDGHGVLWVTAAPEQWGNWGRSTRAAKAVADFERDGLVVMAAEDDLRTFAALHYLGQQRRPGWEEWLRRRRPASQTILFHAVFGSRAAVPEDRPQAPETPRRRGVMINIPLGGPVGRRPEADERPVSGPSAASGAAGSKPMGRVALDRVEEPGRLSGNANMLPVGRRRSGEAVHPDLSAMSKHIGVFAGSGSGKTVLLRRLIESCALQGVSSIVLDPNNDLSRLGSAWPEPPSAWLPGDAAAAAAYHDSVEVVVWTPGRSGGRPLSFRPLPDFGAVLDDADEFSQAVDTAVASLAPRARIDRSTAKDERARAVLREALVAYAAGGRADFVEFLGFLEELPENVSSFGKAEAIAAETAATLRAVMVNDRVFAGEGAALDPGVLLRPAEGKRARVSVVNFLGLPTEEQRQGFVNQLELALFSWAKRNPAVDRPLSGLFVLDEAQTLAPSTGSTLCLGSTLALASQARKYGLGMVFATQSPKGIHNRIVGNCATHWYGRINAPSQIAAATEIAEHKGGSTVDLAHLAAGQFYLAADGAATEQVEVPMCLSHHPPTAPTVEEILASVRASE